MPHNFGSKRLLNCKLADYHHETGRLSCVLSAFPKRLRIVITGNGYAYFNPADCLEAKFD